MQTKNREQDDKSATSFAPQSIDTGADHHGWVDGVGLDASSGQGLLELVRFKYSLTAKTSDGGWIHFRMLRPQWFVN